MLSSAMIKETQRNVPTSAPPLWGLIQSPCEECQKTRKRPMAKSVVIRTAPRKEFASRGQADLVDMQSVPMNNYKQITVNCIRTISQSSVFCDQSKANVLQKLQNSSWTSFPFLALRQYFRATMVLSLQPTSTRKLKTFGLLWLQFMAKPVICKVGDLLNDQMVT